MLINKNWLDQIPLIEIGFPESFVLETSGDQTFEKKIDHKSNNNSQTKAWNSMEYELHPIRKHRIFFCIFVIRIQDMKFKFC